MSQMQKGVLAMFQSDHAAGEDILAAAIAGFQALNDPWGIAISRGVLGNIKMDQGDFFAAAATHRESLIALLHLDDLWGLATVLPTRARAAAEQGAFEQAARISGAIQRMHQTMGAPLKVPFRERYERNLEAAMQHLGQERFELLLAEGYAMTPAEAVATSFEPMHTSLEAPTEAPNRLDALAFPLSPREREVLRLVPARTAKQIGEALFISESTVRTHIEHILNKLGLRNQKELVAFVYEQRLV
jgi:DNA-binding CsgD family transcriptional regulator